MSSRLENRRLVLRFQRGGNRFYLLQSPQKAFGTTKTPIYKVTCQERGA